MRSLLPATLAVAAAVTLAACTSPAATDAGKAENLLPNPSFEAAGKGKAKDQPQGWRPDRWAGKGEWHWANVGRTGGRSACIESADGADVAWTTTAGVQPFARYRLSAWIRTEDVKTTKGGRGALLNIHNLQPAATPAVTGTRDWTRVEVEFEAQEQDSVQVNCLFGGWGLATGKAWFDDLRLAKIGERPMPAPAIRIDATKTGEPISKYVYGQFIEHLGRCIYGGIWAEMLLDRKFYYPVTATYDPYGKGRRPTEEAPLPHLVASPWQIVGDPGSVTMVKEDSFVGEHTPRIAVGGGIAQHDLGLAKGKEYVGYVWLKPAGGKSTVQVSLRWGDGPDARQTDTIACERKDYTKSALEFRAGADTDQAALRIDVTGGGPCLVGTVSLMPADAVHGMRADTLALLKELDAPVYRWPGGNFVSGYDWTDGIGPRDRRPPRKNPAWTGVEPNDFGLHEFMRFCKTLGAAGKWSETMMRHCAEHMDLISEHFYRHEKPGLLAHIRQMPEAVRAKADAHRQYRRDLPSLKGKDIDIALDEWNYWYGPHVFGELGTRYFLKDALGIAAGLHEMFRNSDLFYMANYAQTVNVIGAIKTTKTAAAFETTGLALKMYRHHFGAVPVTTETDGLIDATAAWADEGKTLTVGVVNPTRESATIPLTVKGATLSGNGRRWVITGDDPMAYNTPGQPPKVTIQEGAVRGAKEAWTVPPYSITIFALEATK